MESGIYGCPAHWAGLLPPGARRVRTRFGVRKRTWGALALTPDGCRKLRHAELSCGLLLIPGNCPAGQLPHLRTGCVASYGLSPRDSLTFSSLQEPVLCVQRALPAPDGGIIEPQEIPLPELPAPVEDFLPLLGLWLLYGYG
ncbi:MAG: hypothetical protein IJR72_05595 [Oscillospiraceae bacterium]|nr:hypothetical protein [Oscillospiraceae bacterium]